MFAANLTAIRALFFANIAFLVFAPVGLAWSGVAVSVALYYVFGVFGIVGSFHRFHSHNSYSFKHRWVEVLWTFLGHLSGSGSAVGWVAIHRMHHRDPDGPDDPHTPKNGAWRTLTVDYRYGDSAWREVRDMMAKPYCVWMHKYYFLILAGYVSALFAAFGLPGVYYGFSMASVLTLAMSGATNYVSHIPWLGYQSNDAGRSTNVWWSALFNCGEGWHNNHHADPGSYTTKQRWWEFDMTGTAIRMVKNG